MSARGGFGNRAAMRTLLDETPPPLPEVNPESSRPFRSFVGRGGFGNFISQDHNQQDDEAYLQWPPQFDYPVEAAQRQSFSFGRGGLGNVVAADPSLAPVISSTSDSSRESVRSRLSRFFG